MRRVSAGEATPDWPSAACTKVVTPKFRNLCDFCRRRGSWKVRMRSTIRNLCLSLALAACASSEPPASPEGPEGAGFEAGLPDAGTTAGDAATIDSGTRDAGSGDAGEFPVLCHPPDGGAGLSSL